MPLHQDSKVQLDTNPSNHQRLSLDWFNTDGDWQTQPDQDLRFKRLYSFFVWPFE